MANPVDQQLKQRLSKQLEALGAGFKQDGTLGFSDPAKDKAWQKFQQDVAKRGQSSSSFTGSTDQTLENYGKQIQAQAAGQELLNNVGLKYAEGQVPILRQKADIETNAYAGKLGANVAAQSGLLDRNYDHEQRLALNETDRLRMILDSGRDDYDKALALQEKQLQQQGNANMLNFFKDLLYGGALLFG
jgi:hypothetical protein